MSWKVSLPWSLASAMVGLVLGAQIQAVMAAPEPVGAPPPTYSRYPKLDVFARALSIVEQYYVRPVHDAGLIDAALRGLVSELDPHSEYLGAKEARLLREEIEGAFGGVGMVVGLVRDEQNRIVLEVREVVAGGPAHEAGVEAGQVVVAIEGQPIAQFSDLQMAIATIRGEPGSHIRLTIEDIDTGTARTVRLTRARIDTPAVEVRYMGDGIGVLELREFTEGSTTETRRGLAKLAKRASPLRGVVLDLRDNGGGLFEEAIGVADLFLDDGVIVRTRGRRGQLFDEARAHRAGSEVDLPLVVLVNKASASASEIVAGALQDRRRGLIIGERTFGKGSVQSPFELGDGSLLKLTTALYYTPADRLIQATGIRPDVYVGGLENDVVPNRDTRPLLKPERDYMGHLEPGDFGRLPLASHVETEAVRAAGRDLQLRTAVQHLEAWDRVRPGRGRGR